MPGAKKGALLRVIGPVAVLPLVGGGERYVYKDGIVPVETVVDESVQHLVDAGLVEIVDGSAEESPAEETKSK